MIPSCQALCPFLFTQKKISAGEARGGDVLEGGKRGTDELFSCSCDSLEVLIRWQFVKVSELSVYRMLLWPIKQCLSGVSYTVILLCVLNKSKSKWFSQELIEMSYSMCANHILQIGE